MSSPPQLIKQLNLQLKDLIPTQKNTNGSGTSPSQPIHCQFPCTHILISILPSLRTEEQDPTTFFTREEYKGYKGPVEYMG